MIRIGRHINNITLNGLEYILDNENNILYFDTHSGAEKFLLNNGYSEADLDIFVYDECTVCDNCGEIVSIGYYNECSKCEKEVTNKENF